MDATEHRREWMKRYRDTYSSDAEALAGYREAKRTLAELTQVFAARDGNTA
jgi:hypothetical protein